MAIIEAGRMDHGIRFKFIRPYGRSGEAQMTLLLLEALGALLLLVFIVWWTMFSGRKNGELKDSVLPDAESKKPDGQ